MSFQLSDLTLCESRAERTKRLEEFLIAVLCPYLHLQVGDEFPRSQSLFELGLTSLAATEIQHQLEQVLAIKLNASDLFNNPTAGYLLHYLQTEKLSDWFAGSSNEINSQGLRVTALTAVDGVEGIDDHYIKSLLHKQFGI